MIAAATAGLMAGMDISTLNSVFLSGTSKNAELAVDFILLGIFAAGLNRLGLTTLLAKGIEKFVHGNKFLVLLFIGILSYVSGNILPIHIAFIPILIPVLLPLMNKLKLDRRAVVCVIVFGLLTNYITFPIGFGNLFYALIETNMKENGMEYNAFSSFMPVALFITAGIILALIAALIIFRKDRDYKDIKVETVSLAEVAFGPRQIVAVVALLVCVAFQVITGSMIFATLLAIMILIVGQAVKRSDLESIIAEGIKSMGLISSVMFVSGGYAAVIKETGFVDSLVSNTLTTFGTSRPLFVIGLLLIGFLVTMGIGTSFGTCPVIAVLYVPMCMQFGLSGNATALLLATATCLGDAGSPASDFTLGPTSGLNVDGQHDHIWDTCIPSFIVYNSALLVFGFIGGMIF